MLKEKHWILLWPTRQREIMLVESVSIYVGMAAFRIGEGMAHRSGPAGNVAGTSVVSQEEDFGARRSVRRSVN